MDWEHIPDESQFEKNCGVCTMLNPVEATICSVCESPFWPVDKQDRLLCVKQKVFECELWVSNDFV